MPASDRDTAGRSAADRSTAGRSAGAPRMGFGGGPRLAIGAARWSLGDVAAHRARATLHAALDAGVPLVDTARAYRPAQPGRPPNERLIADAARDHPGGAQLTVATKGGHFRADDGTFPIDARPETLRKHCRESLRELRAERIDCYQLHWPDPHVPLAESTGALEQLRREGLVDKIGVCNVSIDQLRVACATAAIDTVQNPLSPFDRTGTDVLAHCTAAGMTYLAYAPFGGARHAATMARSSPALDRLAARYRATVTELVLAWLLAQSPVLVPIVGASSPGHVESAVRATQLEIHSEDTDALAEAVDSLGRAETTDEPATTTG